MKLFFAFVVFINLSLGDDSSEKTGKFKFRAREHFDIHKVINDGQEIEFKGFSNTINFWYEKPLDFSIGFGAGPILGSAKPEDNDISAEFGDKITLFFFGVEGKYYFYKHFFTRGSLGWSLFKSDGDVDSLSGGYGYAAVGYEYLTSFGLGIALEAGARKSFFTEGVKVETIGPSLGLHFYKMI